MALDYSWLCSTVLRSATAKRAHGRGNKLPINLSSLAMQKQTEQAAAITNGRFGNNQRNSFSVGF